MTANKASIVVAITAMLGVLATSSAISCTRMLSTPKPWPAAKASPESLSRMRLKTGTAMSGRFAFRVGSGCESRGCKTRMDRTPRNFALLYFEASSLESLLDSAH